MIGVNRILGLVILLFCMFLLFVLIPWQTESAKAAQFPRIIAIFMGLLSCLLIAGPEKRPLQRGLTPAQQAALARSGVLLGLSGIYLLGVVFVGFYVSSVLGLSAFLFCLGERDFMHLIACPLGITLALYAALTYGLSFQMPAKLLV